MKLIKLTETHYIIVDDSEIKEGDWMYNPEREPSLLQCIGKGSIRGWKKITHSTFSSIIDLYKPNTPLILNLSEVKELIGEVDVEKKAERDRLDTGWEDSANLPYTSGFARGYNQALEDNKEKKYTEEDLRKAMQMYKGEFTKGIVYSQEQIIQSLQLKTEWEVEIIDGKLKLV